MTKLFSKKYNFNKIRNKNNYFLGVMFEICNLFLIKYKKLNCS